MPPRCVTLALTLPLCVVMGCGGSGDAPADAGIDSLPDATGAVLQASDVPIDGLGHDEVLKFNDGDALFDLPFRPADGLGPLSIRSSCGACHEDGARGPGVVKKMAIVEADGVTAAADQSALPYGHTIRDTLDAGATTPLLAPTGRTDVLVTTRVGPPVLGRGYIEAVADAELLRVAAEQQARTDGIHGKVNMVAFASATSPDAAFDNHKAGDMVIGKLGLKARIATLDDFTADAFQGDMGLTTPMRPTELANPDDLTDDVRAGVDLDIDHVNRIAFYMRRIAIPRRIGLTQRGQELFAQASCAVCHVPTLHTRADYPIAVLANIDAPIYSDLLLHDMGPALADGQTDGSADSLAWRTAPLIGERFTKQFLHDGRAHSVRDAIVAHAGEAAGAAQAFQALSADDQQLLVQFVEAL
ncbi:MAG TPA: di-heme oxidoredictase family protein [Kofleriaceae bacterium]|nr:di-heme oxidoredictase family protein [Kofleriaceae bacterium]